MGSWTRSRLAAGHDAGRSNGRISGLGHDADETTDESGRVTQWERGGTEHARVRGDDRGRRRPGRLGRELLARPRTPASPCARAVCARGARMARSAVGFVYPRDSELAGAYARR